MIPKLSTPLAKLVRTGEGVILFAFNAVALLGVIVNDLAPAQGLKYAAIFNTVAFASRQFLKAVAVIRPSVGGDPIPLEISGVSTEQVLAEIAGAEQAAAHLQSQLGTPSMNITAGLSPSEPAPAPGPAVTP